jgi:hypothetical protein
MKVLQFFGFVCVIFIVLLSSVMAAPGAVFVDPCYSGTHVSNGDLTSDLLIRNSCEYGRIEWANDLNLTILGNVVDGDIEIGRMWMMVDSALRPDLDAQATLVFERSAFAVEPDVLKDGVLCGDCNVSLVSSVLSVEVPGFSNYSLSARQDFTVYSDSAPELDNKVYQTIDLGDSNRDEVFSCVVQIFGQSAENPGQWVLVQTNPQREVQGKLLGNPDPNQPESLGYFPTMNGVANVYFRDQNIPGYSDFEYVAQCSSNITKLIYEEPISTKYHPLGRDIVGRGIWLTDGNNLFFIIIGVVIFVLVLLILWKAFRVTRGM